MGLYLIIISVRINVNLNLNLISAVILDKILMIFSRLHPQRKLRVMRDVQASLKKTLETNSVRYAKSRFLKWMSEGTSGSFKLGIATKISEFITLMMSRLSQLYVTEKYPKMDKWQQTQPGRVFIKIIFLMLFTLHWNLLLNFSS